MLQIKIKGHGVLKKYTQDLQVESNTQVKEIINTLEISPQMQESLLVTKDGQIVDWSDLVSDNDEIELFSMLSGG